MPTSGSMSQASSSPDQSSQAAQPQRGESPGSDGPLSPCTAIFKGRGARVFSSFSPAKKRAVLDVLETEIEQAELLEPNGNLPAKKLNCFNIELRLLDLRELEYIIVYDICIDGEQPPKGTVDESFLKKIRDALISGAIGAGLREIASNIFGYHRVSYRLTNGRRTPSYIGSTQFSILNGETHHFKVDRGPHLFISDGNHRFLSMSKVLLALEIELDNSFDFSKKLLNKGLGNEELPPRHKNPAAGLMAGCYFLSREGSNPEHSGRKSLGGRDMPRNLIPDSVDVAHDERPHSALPTNNKLGVLGDLSNCKVESKVDDVSSLDLYLLPKIRLRTNLDWKDNAPARLLPPSLKTRDLGVIHIDPGATSFCKDQGIGINMNSAKVDHPKVTELVADDLGVHDGDDIEVTINVPIPRDVNVRAIREKQRMTQEQFAECYGLSVASLRNWEQGTRTPERPIAIFLRLIDKFPEQVRNEVAMLKRKSK